MVLNTQQKTILRIFKDIGTSYNSRNLSKIIGISHVGEFKVLKKLEKDNILISKKIGNALIYSMNYKNNLTKQMVGISLTLESQIFRRWSEEFKSLEKKVLFVIIFGSILKDEISAKDIDILVVADKDSFNDIKKIIFDRNKISNKKIHLLLQKKDEFISDIDNMNNTILNIIKTGIILYGADEIIKIISERK